MIDLSSFGTPNGREITVWLEEMGLPHRVHVVDITKAEQFAPEFLRIAPHNRIPAIVDPDGAGGAPASVFESGAILLYLAEKTGRFLPGHLAGRNPVWEWLMWQVGGLGPMPGQVNACLLVQDEAARAHPLDRYRWERDRLCGVLDRRLAGREFVATEGEPSIADFAILGWVRRADRRRVDLAAQPAVQAWYGRMMARPAVARGFAVRMRYAEAA